MGDSHFRGLEILSTGVHKDEKLPAGLEGRKIRPLAKYAHYSC